MKHLRDKVVALTGAGSGIGQSLAIHLAQEGCHLAISDYNKNNLRSTEELLSKYNVKVTSHLVDVSARDQVYQYAEDVMAEHGRVNVVINNAGVTVAETIEDMKYEDLDWIFNINFKGVVHGTKAFLPYLKQQDQAHIVNISSISGLIGAPVQSVYCATKFAVRGFTEVLRFELMGSSVGVSCVHPGGVATNILRGSRFYKNIDNVMDEPDQSACSDRFDSFFGVNTPDTIASAIIDGIKTNRYRIIVGKDARFIDKIHRLFPVSYPLLVNWYYSYRYKLLKLGFLSKPKPSLE